MATNKANSAAPAASRTRAPQTSKAAVEGTETRESRGPSDHIVSGTAKPLHGLAGMNHRTDTPVSGDSGGIYAFEPFVFDWYANPVQRNFETLHVVDNKARAVLGETISLFHDSETFSLLYSKYEDALQEAKQHPERSHGDEHDVSYAMFARIYLAGSLCRSTPLEAIYTNPKGGLKGDER